MTAHGTTRGNASLIAVVSAGLWGLYWIPVRRVTELVLPGPWGALALVVVGAVLLLPFAVWHRDRLLLARPAAQFSIGLGGAAMGLYAVGLVYGHVATIVLLFYLSPVWSTLIGRLWLGWATPWVRYASIVVGLSGLLLVLGADGAWPLPQHLGDWLGLGGGALWAVANTGIRTQNRLGIGETTFVGALGGSVATAAVLALTGAAWPGLATIESWTPVILGGIAAAGLWWGGATAGILWAAGQLEPARLGVLLMSEALVGVVSAALFADEPLHFREIAGGALILLAAALEVWPGRSAPRPSPTCENDHPCSRSV